MAPQAQFIIQDSDDQTTAALFQRHRAWRLTACQPLLVAKAAIAYWRAAQEHCSAVEDEATKIKLLPAPKVEISITMLLPVTWTTSPQWGQGDGWNRELLLHRPPKEKPSLASLFLARLSKTQWAFVLAELWCFRPANNPRQPFLETRHRQTTNQQP